MRLELFALIVAIVSGLLPLLLVTRRRPTPAAWLGCLVLILLTLWLGFWSAPPSSARLAERTVADRPIEVVGGEDPYVSSDTCRACHPRQYETWHASYHRKMTQKAHPEAILGDFRDVVVEAFGRPFRLFTRHGQFWVKMHDPDLSQTATSQPIERRIVLTTGSHHLQVYWYATGKDRRLAQLPVMWLREANRWVPRTACFICPAEQRLNSEEGLWNRTCIKCHVTQGRPRIDVSQRVQVDTHVAEFGIACEACHGPAAEHVHAHIGPLRRYQLHFTETPDTTIVNPARLTHRKSAQVCGQCHGAWIAGNEAQWDRVSWSGFSYRPGDELTETRHIFQSGQVASDLVKTYLEKEPFFLGDTFWSDGMIRVSGREYNGLVQSHCFQRGTMSCLSCHTQHQDSGDTRPRLEWANDQLAVGMQSNAACIQCHEEYQEDAAVRAHTHHSNSSTGRECYNCHMPHTAYGLLKAVRSHQVSTPNVQESLQVGRPNACNQCHIDKTLPWTAHWLEQWYGIDPPGEYTAEQQQYSASLLWSVTGDAGQRALAAWTLGWRPALQASRTDWIVPILGQLLDDPYHAVRFVAQRALRSQPGYDGFDFDYLGSSAYRDQASLRAYLPWRDRKHERKEKADPSLLIGADGDLLHAAFDRLMRQRDDRPVVLNE